MYNRYIPTEDGSYRRQRVDGEETRNAGTIGSIGNAGTIGSAGNAGNVVKTEPCPPDLPHPASSSPAPRESTRFDTDELLLIVILLLLLMDDQDEDMVILIAALAFLIL